MDIIENIEIPSFERRRDKFRRTFALITGTIAIATAIERYNGGVTRGLKAIKRGAAAAIMTWMEDRSGTKLFTLEGDEPPPLSQSALRLSAQRAARGLGRAALPLRPRQSNTGATARTGSDQLPVVVTLPEAGVTGVTDATDYTFTPHMYSADAFHGPVDASATPQFFQSTKFFAVLTVDQAKELFDATTRITLKPRQVLFTAGESSEAGIFIVTHGQLGVFLPVKEGQPPVHANTLRYGESVGDLDVVDGAPRSVTCIALDEGCSVVQLPRPLFMAFVHAHPQALTQYLQQGLARLWRVAHFMLSEYLAITLHNPKAQRRKQGVYKAEAGTQTSPEPSTAGQLGDMACSGGEPLYATTQPAGSSSAAAAASSYAPPSTLLMPSSITSLRVATSRPPVQETIMEDEESLASAASLSPAPGGMLGSGRVQTPRGAGQNGDASVQGAGPHGVQGDGQEGRMRSAFAAMAGAPGPNQGSQNDLGLEETNQCPDHSQRGGHGLADLEDEDNAVQAGLRAAAEKLSVLQEQQIQAQERHARQRRKQMASKPAVPVVVGPSCRIQRSPTLRQTFQYGQRACLAEGWDVVDADEFTLSERAWSRLADPNQDLGTIISLPRGGVLQELGWACGQFYLLLDGHLQAERQVPANPGAAPPPMTRPGTNTRTSRGALGTAASGGGTGAEGLITEIGIIRPGSAISCAAFLSYTHARCRIVALEPARLLAFNWNQLETIAASNEPRPSSPYGPTQRLRPFPPSMSGPTLTDTTPGTHPNREPQWWGGPSSAREQDRQRDRDRTTHRQDSREKESTGKDGRNPDVDQVLIPLLVAAATAMGPLIRRFISLGLNRVWLKSGEFAYKQGEDATCLYVVMSGRLRLLHESPHPVTGIMQQTTEEEVGRCEAVGVVFTIAGGQHDTSAICVRDSELVRMSKAAFQLISEDSPMALSRLFANVSRRMMAAWEARMRQPRVPRHLGFARAGATGMTRLDAIGSGTTAWSQHSNRADVVTIAIMPAGVMDTAVPRGPASASAAVYNQVPGVAGARALHRMATRLKEELLSQLAKASEGSSTNVSQHGSPAAMGKSRSAQKGVMIVNSTTMGVKFGTAFDKLDILFYRSKITSWLSNQEDDFRFIILEGDYGPTNWSKVCLSQADVILLVAAEGAKPELSEVESRLVWCTGPPMGAPLPTLSTATSLAGARTGAHSTPNLSTCGVAVPAPTMRQLLHGHDDDHDSTTQAGTTTAADLSTHPSLSSTVGADSGPTTVSPLITAANAAAAAAAPSKPCGGGSTAAPRSQDPTGTGVGRSPGQELPPGLRPSDPIAHHFATGAIPPSAAAGGYSPLGFNPTQSPPVMPLPSPNIPATTRRVELVLLHAPDSSLPHNTRQWLENRPYLARHHHIRMEKDEDMARLARWMRGAAVGLVLSGGGSRGLAHLGVLFALEDAGVPVDVIGGTSQGAFMAALYAQGLDREQMQLLTRRYAQTLSSVRHLFADLTLPVLSVFSGSKFDDMMQGIFQSGAGNIEDLWLPYFCVTTNLTRGEAFVHTQGCLWQLVRASMTIVGLLPPVCLDGELLVDGGYMNNIPVDVIRSMGVETVIVVDVESKDDYGWQSLVPYDGGVSGWRLLWDRWCPIPAWRSNKKLPRYAELINKLTWMTHAHNLKRMNEDYHIDLYLRPPNIGSFRLMDFHLMNRIVRDAYKDALNCLHNWQKLPSLCKHHLGGGSQPATPRGTQHTPAAAAVLNNALYRIQSDAAAVYGAYGSLVQNPALFHNPFFQPEVSDNAAQRLSGSAAAAAAAGSTSHTAGYPHHNMHAGDLPAAQLLGADSGGGGGLVVGNTPGNRYSQDGNRLATALAVGGYGQDGRYSLDTPVQGGRVFSTGVPGSYPVTSLQVGSPTYDNGLPQGVTLAQGTPGLRTTLDSTVAAVQGLHPIITAPGSAARAHSIALAAAAEMLSGPSLLAPTTTLAGALANGASLPPVGTPGGPQASIRAQGMLSASAAAAPPPTATAIAVEALSRVSYTGGVGAGVDGGVMGSEASAGL